MSGYVMVTPSQALEMLKAYGAENAEPIRGKFAVAENDGIFTAIDNVDGNCWTESFKSLAGCEAYLLDEGLEAETVRRVENLLTPEKLSAMTVEKMGQLAQLAFGVPEEPAAATGGERAAAVMVDAWGDAMLVDAAIVADDEAISGMSARADVWRSDGDGWEAVDGVELPDGSLGDAVGAAVEAAADLIGGAWASAEVPAELVDEVLGRREGDGDLALAACRDMVAEPPSAGGLAEMASEKREAALAGAAPEMPAERDER